MWNHWLILKIGCLQSWDTFALSNVISISKVCQFDFSFVNFDGVCVFNQILFAYFPKSQIYTDTFCGYCFYSLASLIFREIDKHDGCIGCHRSIFTCSNIKRNAVFGMWSTISMLFNNLIWFFSFQFLLFSSLHLVKLNKRVYIHKQ